MRAFWKKYPYLLRPFICLLLLLWPLVLIGLFLWEIWPDLKSGARELWEGLGGGYKELWRWLREGHVS